MIWTWILSHKVWVFAGGLVIILLLMWSLGGVDAGLKLAKQLLVEKETQAAKDLETKLAVAEAKTKATEDRSKSLEARVASKEKQLVQVRTQLIDVQRRLSDAEQKLKNIVIPVTIDDRVKRLRELGLKSAVVAPAPVTTTTPTK